MLILIASKTCSLRILVQHSLTSCLFNLYKNTSSNNRKLNNTFKKLIFKWIQVKWFLGRRIWLSFTQWNLIRITALRQWRNGIVQLVEKQAILSAMTHQSYVRVYTRIFKAIIHLFLLSLCHSMTQRQVVWFLCLLL